VFPSPKTWNRIPQEQGRPYDVVPATYPFEHLEKVIRGRFGNITGVASASMVRLKGPFWLCNKHVVFPYVVGGAARNRPAVFGTVTIEYCGARFHVLLTGASCVPVKDRDLVVLYLPEIPPLQDGWELLRHFPTRGGFDGLLPDESRLVRPGSTVEVTTEFYRGYDVNGGSPSIRYLVKTVDGDCGSLVLLRFADTWVVAGMHGLLLENLGIGVAEMLVQQEIRDALMEFPVGRTFQGEVVIDLCQTGRGDVTFDRLPFKSSLRVSMETQEIPVIVLGTANNLIVGSTVKTKVVPLPWREDPRVLEFEAESCGFDHYWEAPNFKGEMRDGVWVDPFTVGLGKCSNVGGDVRIWERAVQDFIGGVSSLVGRERVRPLSDYQAYVGIDGTNIGGTNSKTSAGAPFFAKKELCVRIDSDTRTVDVREDLQAHINQILWVVDNGDLYSPLVIHTLKDEALSVEKNWKKGARVFTVLPFAFNFLLKKYVAPLVEFCRYHAEYFEYSGGFDVLAKDVERLVTHLGDGKKLYHAGDRSGYDWKASTTELLYSCYTLVELGKQCGYNEEELKRLKGLLLSCVFVTRCQRNDFFVSSFMMPSGFWVTLFLNCVRNSLQTRYAYFLLRPLPLVVGFRDVVQMWVLGDDNVAAVSVHAGWFTQNAVASALKEIGVVLTSPQKDGVLRDFENFEDVVFLRRRFRKRGNLWVMPIERSSLSKMLCVRVRGHVLSDKEHAREILRNVWNESFLHGSDEFDRITALIGDLAVEYQIQGTLGESYETCLEKYVAGSFSVWAL